MPAPLDIRPSQSLPAPDENMSYGIPLPSLPESLRSIDDPKADEMKTLTEYPWGNLQESLMRHLVILIKESDVLPTITEPPQEVNADLAASFHKLAKSLQINPADIAIAVSSAINIGQKPEFIQDARPEKGFVNLKIDIDRFGKKVLNDVEQHQKQYGEVNIGNGATVVVDCSSPNIAKFMSVGHLRSTVIGESLARMYKAAGYRVIRDNHLGDWGTQFGMLGRAYELWKDEIPELRDNTDSVKGLYKLYTRMHEEIEKEKAANPDGESSLEKEGKAWFQRLETGDPEAIKMWQWSLEQSLKEFQRVYDLLDTKYEYMLGESFYVGMLPHVVKLLQERGIAEVGERGAIAIDLEKEKLGRLVVQKSDGTSLYATRDLATLIARNTWFKPEKILYVVGVDQNAYFRQVFAAFQRLNKGQGPQTEHIQFGLVSLPEGKMSTRRGRVVFLEDVLSESIQRARTKIVQSGKDIPQDEIEKIAQQVGVGAVIYFDLRQGRERNIKFNWDEALSPEGNTASYLQYAHARACSILRRAQEMQVAIDTEQSTHFVLPIERTLVKQLSKFPEAIAKATSINQPSAVAEYIYETASLFNEFYRDASVLKERDSQLRNTRLRLSAATAQVIKNGLYLLGIEAPERM